MRCRERVGHVAVRGWGLPRPVPHPFSGGQPMWEDGGQGAWETTQVNRAIFLATVLVIGHSLLAMKRALCSRIWSRSVMITTSRLLGRLGGTAQKDVESPTRVRPPHSAQPPDVLRDGRAWAEEVQPLVHAHGASANRPSVTPAQGQRFHLSKPQQLSTAVTVNKPAWRSKSRPTS